MYSQPLAFVDLETTGTHPTSDRVIEVAIITLDPSGEVEEWSSLVNPGSRLPPFIESLTGIRSEMTADAPAFDELAPEILERLDGRLMVAHNARFDYGFLKNEFARLGERFVHQPLCTVKLSRKLFPEQRRHNLDTLIRTHGLDPGDRHRAMADARVLLQFLAVLYSRFADADVDAAIDAVVRRPSLPRYLPAGELDALPEVPGVYRFYGENGVLLYVGKSKNIRSRVMAHFAEDTRSNKEMRLSQQVRRVDYTETAGELGALLREAQEIKTRMPVHNRQLRRQQRLTGLRLRPQSTPQVEIVDLQPQDFRAGEDLFGLFRTRRAAQNCLRELATEYRLCPKLLGLESRGARGSCFAFQLGRCNGACCGEESERVHLARLIDALSRLKLKSWPWPGCIAVRERSADGRRSELHILDNWCYLGSVDEDEQFDLFTGGEPEAFDLDSYRILVRHLLAPGAQPEIIELPRDQVGPDGNTEAS